MKKLNVWSENESENVGGIALQEMAQTGLFEKVKALFEKDVDRGLEPAETLSEKRTREYARD